MIREILYHILILVMADFGLKTPFIKEDLYKTYIPDTKAAIKAIFHSMELFRGDIKDAIEDGLESAHIKILKYDNKSFTEISADIECAMEHLNETGETGFHFLNHYWLNDIDLYSYVVLGLKDD